MKQSYKTWIYTVTKYALVGLLGAGIHFFSVVVLVEKIRVNPLISSVIGFVFSLIFSFFLNFFWTFKIKSNKTMLSTSIKYTIVSLSGLILNLLIMYIMNDLLGIWYIYAQLTSTVLVPVNNFILNRAWAFKNNLEKEKL